ncbi:MAG: hypothetical protein KDA89_19590, partial [Planctomycetaceae bacterium]|nr:hypothetical protein [Planctomycetaceae bacterium]
PTARRRSVGGDQIHISVAAGGPNRYMRNRWGLVQGTFRNKSDTEQEVLAVVIPKNSGGIQYARRVRVPPNSRRTCQWPVLVPDVPARTFDFEYLTFRDSDGTGAVDRALGEEVVRSFTVLNPETRNVETSGYRGLIVSGDESEHDRSYLEILLDTLRAEVRSDPMALTIDAETLDGYPEALECLDQLVITSRNLHERSDACDAIRVWTQRGGRTWLCVDQTGSDTVRALLGDALPLTIVDETTLNHVEMKIAPSAPERHTERSVTRDFPNPVRLVRAIAERGETHWTVDDWPIVVELPFGNGTFLLTFMSPEVYVQVEGGRRTLPCAVQISECLFRSSGGDSLIQQTVLADAAASQIGYSVPSRSFAAVVMLSFVVLMTVAGLRLYRQDAATRLSWIIPALSVLCAVPAVWSGHRSRNVAPSTAVDQLVMTSVDGQTVLAADGLTSVYQPAPTSLSVQMNDYAIMMPDTTADSGEGIRRIVWTDLGQSRWENLSQDAGIRNFQVRSLTRLETPEAVKAVLTERGLTGQLTGTDPRGISDPLLAGEAPDRAAVILHPDGSFTSSQKDVLAPNEFVTGTILSDAQKRHSRVYEELFRTKGRDYMFPDRPALMFWTASPSGSVGIGESQTQRIGTSLVIRNIELTPPAADTPITIPATLLPLKSVRNADGGVGLAFSNRHREWLQQEAASTTLLEVRLPEVCLPFDADAGEITLRISAGSRKVRLLCGRRTAPTEVATLDSPAGLFTLPLTSEHLTGLSEDGLLYILLEVGAAEVEEEEEMGVREDHWRVERLLVSLHGQRRP